MIVAAKAMALAGGELLARPELRQRAKAAFREATGGKPYVSALPPEMMVPPGLGRSGHSSLC